MTLPDDRRQDDVREFLRLAARLRRDNALQYSLLLTNLDALERPAWTPFEEMAALPGSRRYRNSRYTVTVREEDYAAADAAAGVLRGKHLSVSNRDTSARHDWRDFQRLKNELVAPDWEAVELYPAERRLCDSANQYHLFAFPGGTAFAFLGFQERLISEDPGSTGAVQRPWEPGQRPPDAATGDELYRRYGIEKIQFEEGR